MSVDLERAAARVAAAVAHDTNPFEIDPAADFGQPNRAALQKANSRGIDPFTEVGTTGLRQFGGYVLEEWLFQLSGRKAAWVWREMLDNDPIVGAIMFAIKMLARTIEWPVQEGNDAQAAEFVEQCLHDMEFTWSDTVNEILSFLPYGWALEEEVYKRRQGPQNDPPWNVTEDGDYMSEDVSYPASSKFTDGKIGWRKFSVRAQETLLRWGFDGYSGIRYMEQIDWHGGDHKIPLSKALLFRTQKDRNNPEGRSILRNAFSSYYAVKNIKQIEAIGVERDLAGVPVITPPEGVNLFAPGQSALLQKVQRMVTGLRRDEYEGIVLPSAGWELVLLSAAGSRQFDTDKVIRRYRQDVAVSMLADFVLIGQDSVGSYAMVDVKSDLFGTALDGIFDLICEVMNKYAIPRLLKLNGMDVSDPPKLTHESARKMDLERTGAFLQAISLAGAPIPWSMELLRALFTDAGLPADFKDYEAAEDLPGQQEDPKEDILAQPAGMARAQLVAPKPQGGAPNGARAAASAPQGTQKAEGGGNPTKPLRGLTKADSTRVPEGTIIDVQPALQARARVLSDQLDQEIQAALGALAEEAATAYSSIAEKASGGFLHRLVGRVMRSLNIQAWVRDRLLPILKNHAARVALDVQRTLQTEINLELHVADAEMKNIADSAGEHLGMRDIEPQVRQSILNAVREGLARGDAPVKTAQRIRQSVPAGRFVHAGPGYRAQLIAKNETANLMREATLASYRSNPHITHLELRDGIYGPPRSDAACMARDGDIVPVSQEPQPYHPSCTLSYSPVVSNS